MQTNSHPFTSTQQRSKKRYVPWLLMLMLFIATGIAQAASNSITTPDPSDDEGWHTSLVLDSNGNPVISYINDNINQGGLTIMHCNDPNCDGNDESISVVDSPVSVVTSLVLDSSGNPVVTYRRNGPPFGLRVLHCNDPNCTGGDESITAPDADIFVGAYNALALDNNGYPVIVTSNLISNGIKVIHCNDVNCAGNDESSVIVDNATDVLEVSMALDSSGNPVVAYEALIASARALKILHCNDPDCTGNDESITTADSVGSVGSTPSLVLDSSGNPVVSYYDLDNTALKIMHCNDPNCTGSDESIVTADSDGSVGFESSLALDSNGYPVVSYYGAEAFTFLGYLNVMHCNDPNCAGSDESITTADADPYAGRYTSLVLDSSGNPVVSYFDQVVNSLANGDLKVLHCGTPTCAEIVDTTPPAITPNVSGTMGNNGWYTSDVEVNWAVTDDESEVSSTTGCDTTTITSDTTGTTLICEATSDGGTNSNSVTIKRDATSPETSVTGVEDGATYPRGFVPDAGCETTDAASGVETEATLTVVGGDAKGVGTFTATCAGAVDAAGHEGEPVSATYTVVDQASCDPASGFNVIHGTPGNDKLVGTDDNDIIIGYGGNDRIEGLEGHDCIIGGPGNDRLYGDEGNDILWGGELDNATVYAKKDRDKLYGDDGDDELYGGGDRDHIDAGAGDDLAYGGDDFDKIYGKEGNDELHGEGGRDAMRGDDGDDILTGGDDKDNLQGNDGDDMLSGDDGDDKLYGGKGDDIIDGGDGDRDAIQGSQGIDTCTNGESVKGCEL